MPTEEDLKKMTDEVFDSIKDICGDDNPSLEGGMLGAVVTQLFAINLTLIEIKDELHGIRAIAVTWFDQNGP